MESTRFTVHDEERHCGNEYLEYRHDPVRMWAYTILQIVIAITAGMFVVIISIILSKVDINNSSFGPSPLTEWLTNNYIDSILIALMCFSITTAVAIPVAVVIKYIEDEFKHRVTIM